jgi:hypothetical protein
MKKTENGRVHQNIERFFYHIAGNSDLKKTYFENSLSYEQSEHTVG